MDTDELHSALTEPVWDTDYLLKLKDVHFIKEETKTLWRELDKKNACANVSIRANDSKIRKLENVLLCIESSNQNQIATSIHWAIYYQYLDANKVFGDDSEIALTTIREEFLSQDDINQYDLSLPLIQKGYLNNQNYQNFINEKKNIKEIKDIIGANINKLRQLQEIQTQFSDLLYKIANNVDLLLSSDLWEERDRNPVWEKNTVEETVSEIDTYNRIFADIEDLKAEEKAAEKENNEAFLVFECSQLIRRKVPPEMYGVEWHSIAAKTVDDIQPEFDKVVAKINSENNDISISQICDLRSVFFTKKYSSQGVYVKRPPKSRYKYPKSLRNGK